MSVDPQKLAATGTARLRIRAEKNLGGKVARIAATLRVQTAAGLWLQRFTIPIGSQSNYELEVPPGDYSLEAVLPSGEKISCDGSLGQGGEDDAILEGPDSQHEWLSWASFALDRHYLQQPPRPADPQIREMFRLDLRYIQRPPRPVEESGLESLGPAVTPPARPSLTENWGGQIRYWARVEDTPDGPLSWHRVDPVPTRTDHDSYSFVAEFGSSSFDAPAVLAEVVGKEDSVYCWLPLQWRMADWNLTGSLLVIDLVPETAAASSGTPSIRARATVQDPDLAQMSGYQRHGEVGCLKEISANMALQAENLLGEKLRNPLLAAAAAFALLNTRELERLHHWTFNLADWFPWLPDGAIIRAWQLLYDQKQSSSRRTRTGVADEPRALLLEAARRGLPVFSEGLRLLVQGLRVFASEEDEKVQKALRSYEALLWNAQSRQGFSSIRRKSSDAFRR